MKKIMFLFVAVGCVFAASAQDRVVPASKAYDNVEHDRKRQEQKEVKSYNQFIADKNGDSPEQFERKPVLTGTQQSGLSKSNNNNSTLSSPHLKPVNFKKSQYTSKATY